MATQTFWLPAGDYFRCLLYLPDYNFSRPGQADVLRTQKCSLSGQCYVRHSLTDNMEGYFTSSVVFLIIIYWIL